MIRPLGAEQSSFDDLPQTVPDTACGVGNPHVPLREARPLILNHGMGVDSTAMACKLREEGIVPDLVIFANTGSERGLTYAWLQYFSQVMVRWGWPPLVVVQYSPVRAAYDTLLMNCIINKTLPSISFGYGACSDKYKRQQMDSWICGVSRGPNAKAPWAPAAAAWAAGSKLTKLIGYDNGPKDARRQIHKHEDELFFYRYPLREEWQMDRLSCLATIQRHGFVPPPKSSCHFCIAMKDEEVWSLLATEPVLFLLSLWMEAIAMPGLTVIEGLWRTTRKGDGRPGSWLKWAEFHVQPPVVKSTWQRVTKRFRSNEPVSTFNEIVSIELTEAGAAYARLNREQGQQVTAAAAAEVRRIEALRR